MCEGLSFCSSCTEQEVEDWAYGRTHTAPTQFPCGPLLRFDINFKEAAQRIRSDSFLKLLKTSDPKLLEWPEATQLAERLDVQLEDLLRITEHLPEPTYLRKPRKNATARQRKRHQKAWKRWNSDLPTRVRHMERHVSSLIHIPLASAA